LKAFNSGQADYVLINTRLCIIYNSLCIWFLALPTRIIWGGIRWQVKTTGEIPHEIVSFVTGIVIKCSVDCIWANSTLIEEFQ
jgi:hypothetical protein